MSLSDSAERIQLYFIAFAVSIGLTIAGVVLRPELGFLLSMLIPIAGVVAGISYFIFLVQITFHFKREYLAALRTREEA